MKSIYIAKRVLFSNIPMLLVIMVMALAFTLIFGKLMVGGPAGNPVYDIALTVEGDGGLAEDFRQGLLENPHLRVTEASGDEARKLVRERKVVLALLLNDSFNDQLHAQEGPELTFLRDEENNLYIAARQEVERELTRIRVALVAANRLVKAKGSPAWAAVYQDTLNAWREQPVTVEKVALGIQQDPQRQVDRAGVGMTVMFVMITVITASGAILDERNRGTWQRIITSPVGRGTVLTGYLLSYFFLGLLQFTILIVAGRLLMGLSWGDPLGVAVVTVVYLLCSISLGLVIAGVVRTYQQQQAVSSLIVTATSMLGGLFWPLDFVPPVMQTVAKATPQYWAMVGYEQLLYRGLDWSVLQRPILVLLAFTAVFFLFGISRIRFE